MADSIRLKWGTLKGWNLNDEISQQLLQKYLELGTSMSCMHQDDTDEQKQILCDLIGHHTEIGGTITNDWDGNDYTKDEAIDYLMNYRK